MNAKIKNVLLESNVPILNKMIAANRKLKQLDFTQILSGDYYTYGPERVFLRTIVRKWK